MNIFVGDTVTIPFGYLICNTPSECINAAICTHHTREANLPYFKGKVIKVTTHSFIDLIKLKEPIYTVVLDIVNFPMKATTVKKVIRIPC